MHRTSDDSEGPTKVAPLHLLEALREASRGDEPTLKHVRERPSEPPTPPEDTDPDTVVKTSALETRDSSLWARTMARGHRRLNAGQRWRAVWSFYLASRLAPESADSHGGLGAAWLALGFVRRAVRAYKRALEIAPDDRQLLAGLNAACERLDSE